MICWDPFHVVALGTRELDVVRRAHWNQLRDSTDATTAKRFKGARWALLKRPDDLSDRQHDALLALKRAGGATWRAYQLKEALRGTSIPTCATATSPRCWTAGAPGRNAAASPGSSASPAPSARTATASSPPSASTSPTHV